jgi:hypothetical protein
MPPSMKVVAKLLDDLPQTFRVPLDEPARLLQT